LAKLDVAGIGTLQLIDAGALNIVGSTAIGDLRSALLALSALPALRVLVLRGSGERAFIGGADIGEMATLTPATAQAFITRLAGLCDAVAEVPVPVVARLAGWCLGGGLEVALACDLRLADDSAVFGMPEVKVGIPSVIHAALLPRLIGSSRANAMLLCCENIDAARAEAWGLVHERCATGQLDVLVQRRAEALAALPPQALRQQKRLLRHWQTVSLAQAVQDSIGEFALAYASGEPQALMGEFMAHKRARRAKG
jgi:enoyl-CoA hydratase/carnithine racemase